MKLINDEIFRHVLDKEFDDNKDFFYSSRSQ